MGREWGSPESAPRRTGRTPRRRPPIRSYIPFALFVVVCLSVVLGVLWLVVSIAHDLTGSNQTASPPAVSRQTSQSHTGSSSSASTAHSGSKAQSGHSTGEAPTLTPVGSLLGVPGGNGVEISPGGPLPTKTPVPTATATGRSGLVVAREVDLTGKALQTSTRFVVARPAVLRRGDGA